MSSSSDVIAAEQYRSLPSVSEPDFPHHRLTSSLDCRNGLKIANPRLAVLSADTLLHSGMPPKPNHGHVARDPKYLSQAITNQTTTTVNACLGMKKRRLPIYELVASWDSRRGVEAGEKIPRLCMLPRNE